MTGEIALSESELVERAEKVREALPQGGLFAEKEWRVSPFPFPLDRKEVKILQRLGPLLLKFQLACDTIYRRSRKGTLPSWIRDYLDRGKPPELLEAALVGSTIEELPRVIRPDLILTEDGFAATELDSVPGGIGLTAWLADSYARLSPETRIVGGSDGMLSGFGSIFGGAGGDILVSEESAGYRPEMTWLAARLGAEWHAHEAETYDPHDRDVYRFFELFDLSNIPSAYALARGAAEGRFTVTSPFKPWLEEKMWSALFWSHPLREVWRRELRDANFRRLQELCPRSWIVDPAPVPHHAVLPGLDIQAFDELKDFSQTERELVLKLSGFSERAWGSRSVTVGQDASHEEWSEAVDEAITSFPRAPFVLQEFHRGRLVRHPWLNPESGQIEVMEGRVRLCPYYFVNPRSGTPLLGGVLATICPSDKKVLHGMRDAILVPCAVS